MVPQSQGKMFLAEERGCVETDWFRSYCTFNSGSFHHQHKTPAGNLYLLNEDTLAAQHTLSFVIEAPSEVVLFPVIGAIAIRMNGGQEQVWEAGTGVRLYAGEGDVIEISNPYADSLVNYVQLRMKRKAIREEKMLEMSACSFHLSLQPDCLIPLFADAPQVTKYYIGKFNGRAEWLHRIATPGNALFFYVLQGAFEVQYRLLHARDGLWLWNIQEAELEALSNDAIILVTEIPYNI